tara:strand:- start:340 stop:1047 length:708 start_codon:yes stop_codon:yes gene_type:complete
LKNLISFTNIRFLICFLIVLISNQVIYANQNITYDNSFILITKDFERTLFSLLERADHQKKPKKYIRDDGSIYYKYKSNRFKPKLSVNEIKKMISKKQDFSYQRNYIRLILRYARNMNIDIVLSNDKSESSALWFPSEDLVKINTNIIEHGTKGFAEILNHEVIHIAQSCNSINSTSQPKLLNIETKITKENMFNFNNDIYKYLSPYNKKLEREAYSNQSNLKLGLALIEKYCLK